MTPKEVERFEKMTREEMLDPKNWRIAIGNFAGKDRMPKELRETIIHTHFDPLLGKTVTPNCTGSLCDLSELNKDLENILDLAKKLGYEFNGAIATQWDKYNESKVYICKNNELFILDKEYQDNFIEEWDNFMDGVYNDIKNPRFMFM